MTPQYLREEIQKDPQRKQALVMAEMGFSYRYISESTGLSIGKIQYWCRLSGVKLANWRNGQNKLSQYVQKQTRVFALNDLEKKLKQLKEVNPPAKPKTVQLVQVFNKPLTKIKGKKHYGKKAKIAR